MRYFLPLFLAAVLGLCLWQWRRSHRAAAASSNRSQKIISAMDNLYSTAQIQQAAAEARAALPTLQELFAERPQDTSVLVRYRPPHGPSEVVWARLTSVDDSTVTCRIRMRPSSFPDHLSIDYSFPISELLDWQVRVGEREVRGGFTLRGMRVLLRELYGEERVAEFDRDLKKYVDWTDIT